MLGPTEPGSSGSMLTELTIQNFSIIESTEVSFREGFHVLSGETGAGKSILAQAIAFVLGARADQELLRSGTEEATVTGVFSPNDASLIEGELNLLGITLDPGEGTLLIRRQLNSSGRSRAFLNDRPITLRTLQSLGKKLTHQVGQYAAQELFNEGLLLSLLDAFGNHADRLEIFQNNQVQFEEARRKYQELEARVARTRDQEDYLCFQRDELEKAKIKQGEEKELEQTKQRLKNKVALAQNTFAVSDLIFEGDNSVSDGLGKALTLAQKAQNMDGSLEFLTAGMERALEELQNLSGPLQDYLQGLDEEGQDLDGLETRLALIHELKRKYKTDESGLMQRLEELKSQLVEAEDFEALLQESRRAVDKTKQDLIIAAQKLNGARTIASEKLVKKLKKNLKELALPHAQLEWNLLPLEAPEDYRRDGADRLTLLLSFNPGETPRPFQEIISGGELSRFMIALFEVLYPPGLFGTFIFDEVDAGVSSGVAELVGRKLKKLSHQTQVLCITHLPQIASQALRQYVVEKTIRQGRTFSEIRELKPEERVQEIARMLAGVQVTDQAIQHAKSLLKFSAA